MKKIRYFILAVLFYTTAYAQTSTTETSTSLDTQLSNVPQTSITSGIIYERTLQIANLYNFNKSSTFNTANYDYFKQAMLELNAASNGSKFITVDNLKYRVASTTANNQVDVGILNSQFNILNFNIDNPSAGGLTFNETTKKFVPIINKVPFYMMDVTIIAPTKNTTSGTSITYNFKNELLFTNGTKTIKTLVANFGDGINRNIISNQLLINQSIIINYTTSGVKTSTFTITYNDNSSIVTYGKLFFKYITPPSNSAVASSAAVVCAGNDPLFRQDDFTLTADIPYTGYESGDQPLFAKIDYRVYYSKNNTQKQLKKPIIVLDGFDPGDKRKFEDCDCENDPECASKNLDGNGNFNSDSHRSIVDVMKYIEPSTSQPKDLLKRLREDGYDVILVNHPTNTIINPQQPTTTNYFGAIVPNYITIDGGADYIERNAMAYVKLLTRVNNLVVQNGSTDRISIIGPSMGGQISRYALAYMEKNNIPHNVKLWVSVDSPHLGANIPIGDQAMLNLVKEQSDAAKDFYQKELRSPAAQEQLIEFHNENNGNHDIANPNFLNAQTILQGLPLNRGNNYFQLHYNNQFNNGLPNSQGWPVSNANFIKISLVNGSLSGSKQAMDITGNSIMNFANDGEKILNIRGFQRVNINLAIGSITFRVHIASLEADNLPSFGNEIRIARFKRLFSNKTTNATNNNSRGVMDNVPGGFFNSQALIASPILESDTVPGINLSYMSNWSSSNFSINNIFKSLSDYFGGGEWYLHQYNPIHSFIPTFSAIAHNQPNQNWNNPLNVNLRCPSEIKTPFDSYYGEAKNSQHTSFTKESVDWLLKELAGKPQAPHFPIQDGLLVGNGIICENVNKTFIINETCKIPSSLIYNNDLGVQVNGWSVEGNLEIVSFTDYSVTVKGTSNLSSVGKIIATFQNGQKIEKILHLGPPSGISNETPIMGTYDWISTNWVNMGLVVPTNTSITSFEWEIIIDSSDFPLECPTANPRTAKFINPSDPNNPLKNTTLTPQAQINWGNCKGGYLLSCFAKNDCGETIYQTKYVQVGDPKNNPCFKNAYRLIAAPNPISIDRPLQIVVNKPMNQSPCNYYGEPGSLSESEITKNHVALYDFNGNLVYEETFDTDEFELKYRNFRIGNYILNISTNDNRADSEIIIVE